MIALIFLRKWWSEVYHETRKECFLMSSVQTVAVPQIPAVAAIGKVIQPAASKSRCGLHARY